ncbi:MAG TPA: hypothetical protein VFS77_11365, partial [Pyrinomonadaceae bacterium]|nr:hypothetical protein [Pyrinomonadaceae bacterium]
MTRFEQLNHQIARLRRRDEFLQKISRKYWNARRVIFIAGAFLALVFCSLAGTRAGWVLAGLITIVFTVVTIFHNKVRDSITRNSVLIEIKQVQVARIRLDWDRLPPIDPTAVTVADHPFATDLDITGQRSLHRLLDSAVTREGSERLKSWLLSVRPDAEQIEYRQALVRELKDHSVFRDKLQLLSALARISTAGPTRRGPSHWDSRILVEWIERLAPHGSLLPTVLFLSALSALNIICITLSALELIPAVWPVTLVVYTGAMLLRQQRISTAWDELQELEKALTHFKVVFSYLESRSYAKTPRLAEVCAPFVDQSKRPSVEVRRLGRLAAALGLRTNPLLSLLVHLVVPWDFIFTHRLELLRKELGHLLPRWLEAWYELEALNSLANFSYLNPHYVFPETIAEQNHFAARKLGHPLLNPEAKVCNDFDLD